MNFEYTHALVCESVPTSLVNGLSLNEHEPIDLEKARYQHEAYLSILETSGIKLIRVQSDENHPDCVFVEDPVIALGNKIFITNPGAESRRGETRNVRNKFLEVSKELNLEIGGIKDLDGSFLEGGDCMFTGQEFIIGLSTRTNQKGIDEFKEFFAEIPVVTCQVSEGLHLKSFMSMLNPNEIIISKSKEAQEIKSQIIERSKASYKFIEVEDDCAANLLVFNGNLLTCLEYDGVYEFNRDKWHRVENSEFKKIDGCLTCRCVFFRTN